MDTNGQKIINNINESYCSFEVSKLLKEKGFLQVDKNGVPINRWEFFKNGQKYVTNTEGGIDGKEDTVQIPTHSLAIEWIRVNFSIEIETYRTLSSGGNNYGVSISKWNNEFAEDLFNDYFKTSQEAIEAALLYTLQNLI